MLSLIKPQLPGRDWECEKEGPFLSDLTIPKGLKGFHDRHQVAHGTTVYQIRKFGNNLSVHQRGEQLN